MGARKRRNQVRRKTRANINKSIVQTVNVKVAGSGSSRKPRQPREQLAPAQPFQRLPASSTLVTSVQPPQQDNSLGLLGLVQLLKGTTPQPAQPSQGLIKQPPNTPTSQGLGGFLASRTPIDSPIPNSPVQEPVSLGRRVDQRIQTDQADLREWLKANIRNIPTTATYRTLADQERRIRGTTTVQGLRNLYRLTKENIQAQGVMEQLPEGRTPADYERYNRQDLMGNVDYGVPPPLNLNENDDDAQIAELDRQSRQIVSEMNDRLQQSIDRSRSESGLTSSA